MKLFTFHDPVDNPEKEPTPERKTSSQERLQDARETANDQNKETERKERAKELKQAAKKRGQQLEASRPDATNEEIAPQGEKLRKKWRRALLEKSHQVLDFFRREDPPRIDGVRLAELMVAERIIVLNTYLETTEPKTDERRNTKTELDFMGLLSEKLSSPEIEVPAEIMKIHGQIVEESAQTRDQSAVIDVDNLPKFEPLPAEKQSDTMPTSPDKAFARYGLVVLAALGKALQATSKVAGAAATTGATSVAVHAVIVASAALGARDSGEVNTPLIGSPEPSPDRRQLTSAVVHETLHPELTAQSSVVQTETTPGAKPTGQSVSRDALPLAPSPLISRAGQSTERASGQADRLPPSAEPVESDGRRFDDMKTHELLALATDIALGGGQYLRRAYESGQIDRNGLIRVLKAHRRGWDYRTEYRQASRQYREQRQAAAQSPEQLPPLREENTARDIGVSDHRALSQEVSPSQYLAPGSHTSDQFQPEPSEAAPQTDTVEPDVQSRIVTRIIIGVLVAVVIIAAWVMTVIF